MGTHCRQGAWVVSGPRDVSAALASSALSVAPAGGQAAGGSAAELIGQMARFSDGEDHCRRRALVMQMLPPVAEITTAAGARANHHLLRRTSDFDIMPMARQLPAEVLGRGLGLEPAEADRAAVLTGMLCDGVTPALRARPATPGCADGAATELTALLRQRLGTTDAEQITAAVSVLFQARDATAALIGSAVLAASGNGHGPRSPGQRVDHVLRHDAPVQCTRRAAVADVTIGGATVPSGSAVWIFVATAEQGAGMPATFGTGPHACPGAAHAIAIARQVVAVIAADGWRPLPGQRVDFEARPNLRVPARVLVTRS